jgi:hypothetical protein
LGIGLAGGRAVQRARGGGALGAWRTGFARGDRGLGHDRRSDDRRRGFDHLGLRAALCAHQAVDLGDLGLGLAAGLGAHERLLLSLLGGSRGRGSGFGGRTRLGFGLHLIGVGLFLFGGADRRGLSNDGGGRFGLGSLGSGQFSHAFALLTGIFFTARRFGGSLTFALALELERLFLGTQLGGLLLEQEPLTRVVLGAVLLFLDGTWRLGDHCTFGCRRFDGHLDAVALHEHPLLANLDLDGPCLARAVSLLDLGSYITENYQYA